MKTSLRSILAISALAIVVAACGTTATTAPEPTAPASASPAAPSPSTAPSEAPVETPVASPEVAGTLSAVDGMAVGGPGASIAEAIASGMTEPVLVNGVLFRETDGTLYLAESLTDASAPTFGDLRLEVIDYPASEAEWDLENAELTGLQEANGILFFESKQVFGIIQS